jgi:uncharacterized protein (TIGR02231 family)
VTTSVEAPIVAVTVYPGQARITRRTTVELPSGPQRLELGGLPLGLQRDSVRVSGRGEAAVLGVDVTAQLHPRSPDVKVAELTDQLRKLRSALDEVDDKATVADRRAEVLGAVGRRAGGAFAKALAQGSAGPAQVAEVNDALSRQFEEILAHKRELAQQREKVQEDVATLERALAAHHVQQTPDRMAVLVDLDVTGDTVEIELSYVVDQAYWESGYDIRLAGERLTLTWHALVTQSTGEDWPECELRLSTARPASTVTVPELSPWYLDRQQPVRALGYGAAGAMPAAAPRMMDMQEMAVATAAVEHGATASTYTPSRFIAVPSDGTAHRTTVTVVDLEAKLDHLTAPVHGPEAYLRAVAVNTSEHTLRPGKASVFHESEFVGTTMLELWAPGEEVELNLGIDDRIRVERELIRRTAGKAVLGGTRRREAAYRIKVGNFGPRAARVTVLDQVPVSRDEGIVVKDVQYKPDPAERTELGELTWRLDLAPEQTGEITIGFRVDVARGVEITGWRD